MHTLLHTACYLLHRTHCEEKVVSYRHGLLLLGEKTGTYKTEEGQCNTGTTNKITVADVADFMLKTLESNEYDRKGIAIAGL